MRIKLRRDCLSQIFLTDSVKAIVRLMGFVCRCIWRIYKMCNTAKWSKSCNWWLWQFLIYSLQTHASLTMNLWHSANIKPCSDSSLLCCQKCKSREGKAYLIDWLRFKWLILREIVNLLILQTKSYLLVLVIYNKQKYLEKLFCNNKCDYIWLH